LHLRLLCALTVLIVMAGIAAADVITLKNGRRYEGKVIAEENGIIRLKIRGGTVSIANSSIAKRERSEVNFDINKYAVRYREIAFGNNKDLARRQAIRIKDGEIDFISAAKQYSTDEAYREEGGDHGWLLYEENPTGIEEKLQEILFAGKTNEVLGPAILLDKDEWYIYLVEAALYREEETGRLVDGKGDPVVPDFKAIILFDDFEERGAAEDEKCGSLLISSLIKTLSNRSGITCRKSSETQTQAPTADYTIKGTIEKGQDISIYLFEIIVTKGAFAADNEHEHGEECDHDEAETGEIIFEVRSKTIYGNDMLEREIGRIANQVYSKIMLKAYEFAIEKEKVKEAAEEPEKKDESSGPGREEGKGGEEKDKREPEKAGEPEKKK